MKKILSLVLTICMLAFFIPATAVSASSYRDWKQYSGYWKDYKLGSSSCTVSKYGCTSTALAMAAVRLGCESEQNFDPGVFVTRMNKAGGYTSGGAIYWGKISTAVPNMSMAGYEIQFSSESEKVRYNTIAENINKGYAVIITILRYTDTYKHWHYVLADSVSNGVLNIIDPGGSNGNIKNKYGNAQVPVYSIRCYKNNNKTGYSAPVTPPVQTHTHTWDAAQTQQGHPHPQYRSCSCGDTYFVGNTTLSSCSSCYPLGNVKFSRSFKKTKGEVTFYRGSGENITSYTITLYKNGSYYDTYNMSSTEKTLYNMPSGKYSAMLTIKNSNTGQQKIISCTDFEFKETYNIYYNANGGNGAPSTDEKIQDTPKTLSSKTPTRKGYIFKGWASSKNALTAQYQPGGTYTKNAQITLYAVWEPEIYTVNFDLNGGIGTAESETVTYGNTIKMPNSVIKEYSYLKGWSKNKNASEAEFSLALDYKISENLTLYAVWGEATWAGEVSEKLSGSGTKIDPYLISTSADLAFMANKINTQSTAPAYEYYKLTDNINLTYTEWVPIGVYGNENQYFEGYFDGNGFTVSDLYITNENSGYLGLFGCTKNSEIKNLTVTGAIESVTSSALLNIGGIVGNAQNSSLCNINSKYFNIGSISAGTADYSAIGAIAGNVNGGTIDDCHSYNCSINLKSGTFNTGMLAGYCNSPISDCTAQSTEDGLFSTASTVGKFYMGGLCGTLSGVAEKCSVSAPYFSNNIKTSALTGVGGLVGNLTGQIKVCSAKFTDESKNSFTLNGDATGYTNLGGLAGISGESAKIIDCKYDGQTLSATSTSSAVIAGGAVGQATAKSNPSVKIKGMHYLSYEDMPKKDGFTATWYKDADFTTPFNFSDTLSGDITLYAKLDEGTQAPDIWNGTSKEPAYDADTKTYIITNGEELAWVSDVSNGIITSGTNFPADRTFEGYYIYLANDIYLNDISNAEKWATEPPANNWKPISKNANYPFKGYMTHSSYKRFIYGLYCVGTGTNPVGLFGNMEGIVLGINIYKGYVKGGYKAGAFASTNKGTIQACYNTSCEIIAGSAAGGIAGINDEGTIKYCYNSGNVSYISEGSYVTKAAGGIAGLSTGSLLYLYNSGNVSASEGCAGGIVGAGGSLGIRACRNTGSVTSGYVAGGIYGGATNSSFGYIDIAGCQNTGRIHGNRYAGGIAGYVYVSYKSANNYASNYLSECYSNGWISTSESGSTACSLIGYLWNTSSSAKIYIYDNYTNDSRKYITASGFDAFLSYQNGNSAMSMSSYFETQSSGFPIISKISETYNTYTVTTVLDTDNSFINRAFVNVNGDISATSADDPCRVGSIVGFGNSNSLNNGSSTAIKNVVGMADNIYAATSSTTYNAEAGNIIGLNADNKFDLQNAYYNTEMNISSSTDTLDTSGTARSAKTMNVSFYTNILGLTPYSSLENLNADQSAVWVLKNAQLPELYYNCLNDIKISEDIENGTIAVDKIRAVDGEIVTVTAMPAEGYVLNKIYVNGEEIAGNTFEMREACEIFATFKEEIQKFSAHVSTNENASATLTNADTSSMTLMSGNTSSLIANDGDEILVNSTANDNFAIDTILVNGEEIVGNSFILTADSAVTMQLTDISTSVVAITNDAQNIGSHEATLSGSIKGNSTDVLKYIRYWKIDNPDIVYTTESEIGNGDYYADLTMLDANTTYQYQMTENGAIKSFTTEEEYITLLDSDSENVPENTPTETITNTTITKLSSGYSINIIASTSLENKKIIVAFYKNNNELLGIKVISGREQTSYSSEISGITAAYARVYVTDLSTLSSYSGAERVSITNQ